MNARTAGRPRLERTHRGFTLAEVIASVAIVVVLAAITIPTIQSRLAVGRGQALAKEVTALSAGLQAFYNQVGTYPRFLDELTAITGAGSHTDTYCGDDFIPVNMTAGQQAKWKGPYLSRLITADYMTADGNTIVDKMVRNSSGTPVFLEITVLNVSSDVATIVEDVIDGPGANFTSGNVKYLGTDLTYRIVVPTICV